MPNFGKISGSLGASPDSSSRTLPVRLRRLVPRDLLDVHRIETSSFDKPWRLSDLRCLLHREYISGTIAESGSSVVGFAFVERRYSTLTVLSLAVAPSFRRRGVGRKLVDHVIDRPDRPGRVVIDVLETDLPSQLFLRACGVRAVGMLPARRYGGSADVIRFEDRADECEGK